MFKLFTKKTSFTALLALLAINSTVTADDYSYGCCEPQCNRLYIGGFGGELWSNQPKFRQTGVAFFRERDQGGPLAVDAKGRSHRKSFGYGGVQIGYEWSQCPVFPCSNLSITTAAEIEAYWYHHHNKAHVRNPTLRLDEHDFVDSFRTNVGVYLVNAVFSLKGCGLCGLVPYFGGGIGAADVSLRHARSIQVEPPEPGINHFNSKTNDSTWAFAAQAKAGVRYAIFDCAHIFAEYRFLYVDSTRFNFGATNYPTHVPTTTWNFDVKNLYYNGFAVGLQYDLY